MLAAVAVTKAQSVTALLSGSNSFNIGSVVYPLNTIILNVRPDSNNIELDLANLPNSPYYNRVIVNAKALNKYTLDGEVCTSVAMFRDFFNAHMISSGAGGGITLGTTVTGADPGGILFADNDLSLRTVSSFTYNDGDGYPKVGGDRVTTDSRLWVGAFTGDAQNLINLNPVAIDGDASHLTGLAPVATTGDCTFCVGYNFDDLVGTPTILGVSTFTAIGNGTATFTFTTLQSFAIITGVTFSALNCSCSLKTVNVIGSTVTVVMTGAVTNFSSIAGSFIGTN
jgi:hypothetical protein